MREMTIAAEIILTLCGSAILMTATAIFVEVMIKFFEHFFSEG